MTRFYRGLFVCQCLFIFHLSLMSSIAPQQSVLKAYNKMSQTIHTYIYIAHSASHRCQSHRANLIPAFRSSLQALLEGCDRRAGAATWWDNYDLLFAKMSVKYFEDISNKTLAYFGLIKKHCYPNYAARHTFWLLFKYFCLHVYKDMHTYSVRGLPPLSLPPSIYLWFEYYSWHSLSLSPIPGQWK